MGGHSNPSKAQIAMATIDQGHQVAGTQYNAAGNFYMQEISEGQNERLAEELGMTRSALRSF